MTVGSEGPSPKRHQLARHLWALVKAGALLAAEGLHPSSKGARIRFAAGKRTVIDGPFTERRT